jgi:hypothetical protein
MVMSEEMDIDNFFEQLKDSRNNEFKYDWRYKKISELQANLDEQVIMTKYWKEQAKTWKDEANSLSVDNDALRGFFVAMSHYDNPPAIKLFVDFEAKNHKLIDQDGKPTYLLTGEK